MDNFDLKKYLAEGRLHKEGFYSTPSDMDEEGLIVRPKDQIHANTLKDAAEDAGFYVEWNAREGYLFFPEKEENYDNLEMELQDLMDENNVQADIEGIFEGKLLEESTNELTQEEYMDLYPAIGRGGLGYQFNYSPKLGGAYITPRDGEDALSIAQEIEGKFEGKLEAEPFQYQDQQFVSGTRAGSIPTGTESTFLRIVKAN